MFFSAAKAVRELGLPQTPVDVALYDAVEWFVAHGYAPRPPSLARPEAAEERRGRTSVGPATARHKA